MKTKLLLITMLSALCGLKVNSQTWSSVGTGMNSFVWALSFKG